MKEEGRRKTEDRRRKTEEGRPKTEDGRPRREIPILFSTPLVEALLENRKTQTRRVRGLAEVNEEPDRWKQVRQIDGAFLMQNFITGKEVELKCPYGRPGDWLWVRETFQKYFNGDGYAYKVSEKENIQKVVKWKPSIHMPKAAARFWLENTFVSMERLKDIEELDAKEEGIYPGRLQGFGAVGKISYREGFFNIWIDINGIESLHENPWVWVVAFKELSREGKPDTVQSSTLKDSSNEKA